MGRGGGGMMNRGGGSGRRPRGAGLLSRGGGGTGMLYVSNSRQREDKRLFEKDYDFEQANTQFEELRVQLANTKLNSPGNSNTSASNSTIVAGSDDSPAAENGDVTVTEGDEKKEDVDGAPAEDSAEDLCYDKAKSFFDTISCEAVERSQG